MADYNNGRVPGVIQQHEKVAEHYGVNSIDLAKEVNDRVLNGEFTWRDDFKDLHPSPFGQELYFRTIKYLLERSWSGSAGPYTGPRNENARGANKAERTKIRRIPGKLLDTHSYVHGRFEPIEKAKPKKGWTVQRKWKPSDNAGTREGFVHVDVLEAFRPGALLSLEFKGKAIGLLVTSGPDAGIIEYSIDGSPFVKADQFTPWSSGLHLPWIVMLDDQLKGGRHRLLLRIAAEKNPRSVGNACRIHHFVAN